MLKHFEFTQDAFNKRLQYIYDYVKEEVDKYEPANDPIYNSRKDVIESIRQWAPFNQIDGAWLRYAVKLGKLRCFIISSTIFYSYNYLILLL